MTAHQGTTVHYFFNYPDAPGLIAYAFQDGRELVADTAVRTGDTLQIDRWGVLIIAES